MVAGDPIGCAQSALRHRLDRPLKCRVMIVVVHNGLVPAVLSPNAFMAALCTLTGRSPSTWAGIHMHGPVGRMGWSERHLRDMLVEVMAVSTIEGLRATTAAASAFATPGIKAGSRITVILPSGTDGYRQALDSSFGCTLARTVSGIHAVIGRKVPADHVGLHGCILHGQSLILKGYFGVVLAIIYPDFAFISGAAFGDLIVGGWPLPSGAHAWRRKSVRLIREAE